MMSIVSGNRSAGARVSVNYIALSVHQCLRRSFGVCAYLGLRSILVLCKQAKMNEDEVLVNAYSFSMKVDAEPCWLKRVTPDFWKMFLPKEILWIWQL